MEVGKDVRVKKGEYQNEEGRITGQVGVGHGRKWVIRLTNDAEITLHARSLELVEQYDDSDDEIVENHGEDEADGGGNNNNVEGDPPDNNNLDQEAEEEFNADWINLVNELQ